MFKAGYRNTIFERENVASCHHPVAVELTIGCLNILENPIHDDW